MYKFFFICFFLPFLLFSKEDTLFKRKVNILFSSNVFIPHVRSNSLLFNGNAPNVDRSIFSSSKYVQTYNFRSNPFSFSLITDIKIASRFYFQTGLTFLQLTEHNIISGDSIKTYNGKYLNSISSASQFQSLLIPTNLEYRINKYFFVLLNLFSGIYSNDKTTYLTPELSAKNNSLGKVSFSLFRIQSIGASVNLFNSNRCYIDLKIIHANLDGNSAYNKFKDNLYYSVGIRFFII